MCQFVQMWCQALVVTENSHIAGTQALYHNENDIVFLKRLFVCDNPGDVVDIFGLEVCVFFLQKCMKIGKDFFILQCFVKFVIIEFVMSKGAEKRVETIFGKFLVVFVVAALCEGLFVKKEKKQKRYRKI